LRYQWLNTSLRNRTAESKEVFPEDWKVLEVLSERFCEQTRYNK